MLNFLVVDDIYVLRHNLKKHIKELGHQVVCEATNGYEAIEMYKKYKPDIVTLDITMPAYNDISNGIDTLIKIKEFDNDAKIIMITSISEQQHIINAIHNGAQGYILKPITQEKLYKAIQRVQE